MLPGSRESQSPGSGSSTRPSNRCATTEPANGSPSPALPVTGTFLRRFDLEHTIRLFKQALGWTTPKIRTPQAGDRWNWLIIAAHAQLRLARPFVADLRRPWERPAQPGRLTRPSPSRVSKHPPERPTARPRTETQPTRPRTPTRLPQPPPRHRPRRRQDRQTRQDRHRTTTAQRLKIKLRPLVSPVLSASASGRVFPYPCSSLAGYRGGRGRQTGAADRDA